MRFRSLPIIAVVGVLGLAACGNDDTANPATPAPADTTATGAAFNDADVTFSQGMIPHHQQAVEMADIALDPKVGASDKVRDLATRIKAGQGPEIDMMTTWLTTWGQPMQMNAGEGHDMSSMDGRMSAEEMGTLGMMAGAEFDTMWMEMMIRHHEGAIAMAQTAKAAGSNPDVLAAADLVITAQEGEIAEMMSLLGS